MRNLNEPSDYEQAHALPAPEIEVRRFGTLAMNGAPRAQRVAAWTLGQLADTIALVLDEHVVAALNGDQITRDRELPLAAGRYGRVHGRRRRRLADGHPAQGSGGVV